MTLNAFLEILLRNGSFAIVLAFAAWYYITKERPRQIERERERDKLMADRQMECDKQHSERMKDMITHLRSVEKEWSEREISIRREHAEAWEVYRQQSKEARDEDRKLFKEMIQEVANGFKELRSGQDRNFALTLAVGEKQGQDKNDLLHRTSQISGQPVARDFDTKSPDT